MRGKCDYGTERGAQNASGVVDLDRDADGSVQFRKKPPTALPVVTNGAEK
jgi:hypothetical protein